MKCLVLSFLMGYNNHVYKRGEYVNIEDDMAVKRLVCERCIALLPLKESSEIKTEEVEFPSSSSVLNVSQKAIEEKAEEKRQERKAAITKQSKTVTRGVKKANGRNN